MQMNENEIVRDFRTAKKKREQIGILAELNQCSREQIRDILLRNGINEAELPSKPGRKRATETEVFQQQIKKNHAKPDKFRSGKPETAKEVVPAAEQEEEVVMENTKEILPMEEMLVQIKREIPFVVECLCLNRIHEIEEVQQKLEEEKRTLREFLSASA